MPSPKRWFPVSHDLFDDPEVLEFLRLFGDRALVTWLWFLSALDRSENRLRLSGDWLRSLSRRLRQTPAGLRRQLDWMLAKGWLALVQSAADGSPAVLSAPNYWKYHRSREPKGCQSGSPPNLPYQIRTDPTPPNPPEVEGEALVRWDKFKKKYPARDGGKVGLDRAREEFLRLSPEEQHQCIAAAKTYATLCGNGTRIPKDPDNFLIDDEGRNPWRELVPAEPAPPAPKPPSPPTQTRPQEDIRKDLEGTPNGRHYLAMAERNGNGPEVLQTSAEQGVKSMESRR